MQTLSSLLNANILKRKDGMNKIDWTIPIAVLLNTIASLLCSPHAGISLSNYHSTKAIYAFFYPAGCYDIVIFLVIHSSRDLLLYWY